MDQVEALPKALPKQPKAPSNLVYRWAVVHKVGRRRIPRAIIAGVPAEISRAKLELALGEAGLTARYSEGGEPLGNHQLVREDRWPDSFDHGGRHDRWTWAGLLAPAGRRIALDVPASLWSRLTLQAAAEGVTLNAWAVRTLEAGLATVTFIPAKA